eukprot:gb/GECG01009444.1/.p1 GENE.gb/GECG01009444.1/~~gb/GECG01009444.1/.p1  ORF type:complete len:261 (+),score=10.76 gb/GECG01009444.1/:1-783(+)
MSFTSATPPQGDTRNRSPGYRKTTDHILPHFHSAEAYRRTHPKGRPHTLAFDRGIPYDFTTDYPERYLRYPNQANEPLMVARAGTIARKCPQSIREHNYATKAWNHQLRETARKQRLKNVSANYQKREVTDADSGSRFSGRSSRNGSVLSGSTCSTRRGADVTTKFERTQREQQPCRDGQSILQKALAESHRRTCRNYSAGLHGHARDVNREEHSTTLRYPEGLGRSINRVNVAYYEPTATCGLISPQRATPYTYGRKCN